MTFSLHDAVRHIAAGCGNIDLTDNEVAQLVNEHGEAITSAGRAVREASQKYEALVVELASKIRKPTENTLTRMLRKDTSS